MESRGHWVLALGMVAAAAIFGWFFHASRAEQDSVRVVGSATRRVEADIVKWRLTIARTATTATISEGYSRLHDDILSTIAQLKQNGVTDDQLTIQSISTFPIYNQSGHPTGHNIQQSILIISNKVADLEKMAVDPKSVLAEGVILENSNLEYFHSDLATIKRDLLKDAMQDAQARAKVLASGSGVSIGRLLNSSVGVFQITEPFSTEVSDYGMYNTATKQKDITVTVRASFLID